MLPTILFDCERMKYPHTGLYYFCLHLGKKLLQTAPPAHRLCFYTPSPVKGAFGEDACYKQQSSLQKFRLPSTNGMTIWHNTYQGSRYYPINRKLKVILTIHDLNFLYDAGKTEAKKTAYLNKLQQKINRADHIVSISEYTLQDVKKHLNLDGKPASVIYNGCTIESLSQIHPPADKPLVPFLFTIGTIVEKKNFHVLPSLLVKNDWHLIIAGITQNEEYKNRIIEEAKKHGVADRLVFTGPVSENDKQWYLKNCKAFAFPSLSEGFGLPVVEAMHFGKPVLLSTSTSLPEVGGDVSYYFESFEPENMQSLLDQSLHDYEINNRKESIIRHSEQFSWEHSAVKYHQVYSDLYKS